MVVYGHKTIFFCRILYYVPKAINKCSGHVLHNLLHIPMMVASEFHNNGMYKFNKL